MFCKVEKKNNCLWSGNKNGFGIDFSIRMIRTNFWNENSNIFQKCQNGFFPKKDICVKRYQTTTTFKTKTSKRI